MYVAHKSSQLTEIIGGMNVYECFNIFLLAKATNGKGEEEGVREGKKAGMGYYIRPKASVQIRRKKSFHPVLKSKQTKKRERFFPAEQSTQQPSVDRL